MAMRQPHASILPAALVPHPQKIPLSLRVRQKAEGLCRGRQSWNPTKHPELFDRQ